MIPNVDINSRILNLVIRKRFLMEHFELFLKDFRVFKPVNKLAISHPKKKDVEYVLIKLPHVRVLFCSEFRTRRVV